MAREIAALALQATAVRSLLLHMRRMCASSMKVSYTLECWSSSYCTFLYFMAHYPISCFQLQYFFLLLSVHCAWAVGEKCLKPSFYYIRTVKNESDIWDRSLLLVLYLFIYGISRPPFPKRWFHIQKSCYFCNILYYSHLNDVHFSKDALNVQNVNIWCQRWVFYLVSVWRFSDLFCFSAAWQCVERDLRSQMAGGERGLVEEYVEKIPNPSLKGEFSFATWDLELCTDMIVLYSAKFGNFVQLAKLFLFFKKRMNEWICF